MKLNWRVLIASVVLVGATIWGINSLRSYSYSGTEFNFGVGSGPVTIRNPSVVPVPARLVSSHVFRVSSNVESNSGRSVSEVTGRSSSQVFEMALPFDISDFTVIDGTNVSFVTSAATRLEIAVYPLNAEDSRTTFIIVVAAVLGSLFLLSSVNDHRWISAARRQKALDIAAAQEAERKTFNRTFGRINPEK